jgi:hypothetical protein
MDRGKTAAAAATDSGSGSSNNRGGGRPQTMRRGQGARGRNEDGTGEVREEEENGVCRRRCAPEREIEEVRANDGWAPGSKSEEVCTVWGAHQGDRVLVHL